MLTSLITDKIVVLLLPETKIDEMFPLEKFLISGFAKLPLEQFLISGFGKTVKIR